MKHSYLHIFKYRNSFVLSHPFLDVTVRRAGSSIQTSVYRKPTFTGLGLSFFFSFIPFSIKKAVIQSFIYRAYRISSSYKLFDKELNFLKIFFKNNGYPKSLIESAIASFLNKQFTPAPARSDVPKLQKFIVLPFFGKRAMKLKKRSRCHLTEILSISRPKASLTE